MTKRPYFSKVYFWLYVVAISAGLMMGVGVYFWLMVVVLGLIVLWALYEAR